MIFSTKFLQVRLRLQEAFNLGSSAPVPQHWFLSKNTVLGGIKKKKKIGNFLYFLGSFISINLLLFDMVL